MSVKVCIITTGQPSTNPRLVKEADALVEAGYEVHVLCAYWASWATKMDRYLLNSRFWSCTYVGGFRNRNIIHYMWTRLRHKIGREILPFFKSSSIFQKWALSRVLPELEHTAKQQSADLYIAHYPGAFLAAVVASRIHNARLGFDIEDLYEVTQAKDLNSSILNNLTEYFESRYLSKCDYITAVSPCIAEIYAKKYSIPQPISILNVFPLSQRPREFRHTNKEGPLKLYWFSQTIGGGRGLEDVISAMGSLRECDIELHLRGEWQIGYRERFFRFVISAGVKREKIVIHSPSPPNEMVRLASLFDVGLALEPKRDANNCLTISNKLFTYLLAGNAVAATDTPGQQIVIQKIGMGGFSYKSGDVVNLSHYLRLWAENRRLLEEARLQAWEWGSREYNWDIEKQKFLRVIKSVLNSQKLLH